MLPTRGSIEEQLAAWKPRLERRAERFGPRSGGVDVDDLVQVALIDVWQALERGEEPSMEHAVNRMRNEVRRDGRAAAGAATGPDVFEQIDREAAAAYLGEEGSGV